MRQLLQANHFSCPFNLEPYKIFDITDLKDPEVRKLLLVQLINSAKNAGVYKAIYEKDHPLINFTEVARIAKAEREEALAKAEKRVADRLIVEDKPISATSPEAVVAQLRGNFEMLGFYIDTMVAEINNTFADNALATIETHLKLPEPLAPEVHGIHKKYLLRQIDEAEMTSQLQKHYELEGDREIESWTTGPDLSEREALKDRLAALCSQHETFSLRDERLTDIEHAHALDHVQRATFVADRTVQFGHRINRPVPRYNRAELQEHILGHVLTMILASRKIAGFAQNECLSLGLVSTESSYAPLCELREEYQQKLGLIGRDCVIAAPSAGIFANNGKYLTELSAQGSQPLTPRVFSASTPFKIELRMT